MNKKETKELTNDMLIADALLRLKAIENLLVAKGIVSKDELLEEMESVAKQIAKSILQKAGAHEQIEDLLNAFQKKPKLPGN